ncbi:MAG: hypothetical protein RIT52_2638 [Pseudomonadota bacterium]|jgi:hypothetical protein
MSDNDELSLGKDDRLPWLEPADDDPSDHGPGRGKAIALGIALVAAVGMAAGGIWYVRSKEQLPNGNGALIRAPEGPYKTRPEEAGGMAVDGQGDASFAASEGADADGKLDPGGQPEAPITDQRVTDTQAQRPVAMGKNASAPVAVGGKLIPPKPSIPAPQRMAPGRIEDPGKGLIQLGAYSSEAAANKAFAGLSQRFPILSTLPRFVVKSDVGGTTFYRLRLAAAGRATDTCAQLVAGGASCILVK